MATNIEKLAELLKAERIMEIADVGGGAFGAARLAKILQSRLEPSRGQRPGRPTDASWTRHPKIPMSEATEIKLSRLAECLSTEERKISPMQVAAHLLEEAIAKYAR